MDWFGEADKARRIEEAVQWSLDKGIKTRDMAGCYNTKKVTEAIANYLREMA